MIDVRLSAGIEHGIGPYADAAVRSFDSNSPGCITMLANCRAFRPVGIGFDHDHSATAPPPRNPGEEQSNRAGTSTVTGGLALRSQRRARLKPCKALPRGSAREADCSATRQTETAHQGIDRMNAFARGYRNFTEYAIGLQAQQVSLGTGVPLTAATRSALWSAARHQRIGGDIIADLHAVNVAAQSDNLPGHFMAELDAGFPISRRHGGTTVAVGIGLQGMHVGSTNRRAANFEQHLAGGRDRARPLDQQHTGIFIQSGRAGSLRIAHDLFGD